jgi:hypothetical protein
LSLPDFTIASWLATAERIVCAYRRQKRHLWNATIYPGNSFA